MSGAGPAAPPAPVMTLLAQASTWISLKQISAAKQALDSLGGADVAAHSSPINLEEQPAT
jgi:hypothetical protein